VSTQYKLVISYEGTSFLGWQKTSEGPSIEQSLETVLQTILQEPLSFQAGSRTDAGVHALEQIVTFKTPKPFSTEKVLISMNQLLPLSIRCLHLEKVHHEFHPTLSSTAKSYRYYVTTSKILSPFKRLTSWHFPFPCDIEKMLACSTNLLGKQDFKAFTNQKKDPHKDTIRTLYSIEIHPTQDGFFIDITGDHFLYKMVRNIVGTLCYIGCGKIAEDSIKMILESKKRALAGITAPAAGLFLKKINYDNFFSKEIL
jgi:tRNA pseudouridine38-40 synthase